MQKKFGIALVTALLAASVAAQAQGIPGGMERGAAEGRGPVGGVPAGGAAAGIRYIFHEVLKIALDRIPNRARQLGDFLPHFHEKIF